MEHERVLVGLGNPGEKYQGTRHNVGFEVVDHLAGSKSWSASKSGLLKYCHIKLADEQRAELIKPQTYMNKSGEAVAQVIKKHATPLDEVWVIHDDLDLELGAYKIQFGTGPKVHNGLLSIYQCLGSDQFWHVRIGVDGRGGERRISGSDYVLGKFLKEEREVVERVVEEVVEKLQTSASS